MNRNVKYRYNPDTDNFERIYPSWRSRMAKILLFLLCSIGAGVLMMVVFFYSFGTPTEENLRRENAALKSQYNILNRRLDNSLKVRGDIQNRDDNFYRVMMQMEPMSHSQRFAGLDNEHRYKELQKLPDNGLVKLLTQRLDLFDRSLYAQSISFDQLREEAGRQKANFRPPQFHEGLDFAAKTGTPVYATGDGVVEVAERRTGYGNCIDLSHGYNYVTRYAHLSEILVKPGQDVKRGDLIGKVGSTGKSTGPHLHYEVRFKDEPQNPVNYYFMDITPEQYAEMVREAENAGHVMD